MKVIGVIGLGSIGLRHARNLAALGHTVVGYDPDENIKEFNNAHLENILDRCEAVVIASPSSMHLEHLTLAANEHLHAFVEKPIATEMSQNLLGRIMNFEDNNKVLMVGYNLRNHSCVKLAKEWLDAGLIGKPLWSNFTLGQYNDRPPYLRDGVILNWSHEIDLCLYLLGGASLVASSTRITNDKDDMSDILLWHENDCRSTIHLDYTTKPEQRHFFIQGTEGYIKADLLETRFAKAVLSKTPQEAKLWFGLDTWNDNYIEEMQAFIDRVDGKQTIGCTGEEGLEVLKICLEVRKQAGLEPQTYEHVSLGICRKCRKLHYSNEGCK